jgi:hypothetical protein
MDHHGRGPVVVRDGGAGGLDQGLDPSRERDAGVGVEPPGGLGAGEGLSGPGQGAETGGDGLDGRAMLLDQMKLAALQALVVGRQW